MGAVPIGPLERFGVGIVGTDVAHDLSFEIVSGPEDAASDQVTLDLREPDFELVEPGRVGWCVVDSEVWMLGQKREDSLGLMSGKVVHDDVDFLVGRLGGHYNRPERQQTPRWCDGRRSLQPPGRCAH